MIIILLVLGIVLSGRRVKFEVESVVTGSAIGQSLLGSGKGVGGFPLPVSHPELGEQAPGGAVGV